MKKEKFDLEDRTINFAIETVKLCKNFRRNPLTDRIIDQLVGSSGSVGANYREANDALGKKDFLQRLKIARRECKEAEHWLNILFSANEINDREEKIKNLIKEAQELRNILSSIIIKCDR